MKDLPRYAFMTHPTEFENVKVIMLQHPYIVASIYEVKQSNLEMIDSFIEDKVQGRCPIAKVKGYSIFLKMYSSLKPCDDLGYQQAILDDMADFVLAERVMRKPGQFRSCDETGMSIRERVRERDENPKFRPRRNRSNE